MSIILNIEDALTEVGRDLIKQLDQKAILRAAKNTIDRGLTQTQKKSAKMITNQYRIRRKELVEKTKKGAFLSRRRVGRNVKTLSDITGRVTISKRRPSMLRFLSHKDIENQSGIKVSNRRRLKLKFKKGTSTTLKRTYVQRGFRGSGNVALMRIGSRVQNKSTSQKGPSVNPKLPSFAQIMRRRQNLSEIDRFRVDFLSIEFPRQLRTQVDKIKLRNARRR